MNHLTRAAVLDFLRGTPGQSLALDQRSTRMRRRVHRDPSTRRSEGAIDHVSRPKNALENFLAQLARLSRRSEKTNIL